uniref:Ig-like domain-containing protein n=1 Tax=Leptobrachium leishanense TaxID=445787 RepID=A0A8C5MAG7_9ANUR
EDAKSPSVFPLKPCCGTQDSSISIGCLASGYLPQTLSIKWNAGAIQDGIMNFPPISNGDLYTSSSQLTISASDWKNKPYSCTVEHLNKTIEKQGRVHNIPSPPTSIPKYSTSSKLQSPIKMFSLRVDLPEATVCERDTLEKGSSPLRTGGNLPFTTEDPTLNENGTYSVASVCSTTIDAWDKGTKYTCTLTYTGITSPFIKIISKGTEDNMSPPIVALFPPTSEEESSKEYVTYTCMASNFYPIDIYIGWSQDNQEIHKSLYVNSDPTWEVENASYFIVSKLKVPYEDWKENKAVSCVVGHKALPLHFIQRTIDKTTGKPTKTFVNIYMSDSNLSCP